MQQNKTFTFCNHTSLVRHFSTFNPYDKEQALVQRAQRVNSEAHRTVTSPRSRLAVTHAEDSERLLDNTPAIPGASGTCSKRPGYGCMSFRGSWGYYYLKVTR
jgi:hypothetical protein